MRKTTVTAAPIRDDRAEPAVALVAYPEGSGHPYAYLVATDDARLLAAQLQDAADDADAAYGPVGPDDDDDPAGPRLRLGGATVNWEPAPGSPEDLAAWPPAELEPR